MVQRARPARPPSFTTTAGRRCIPFAAGADGPPDPLPAHGRNWSTRAGTRPRAAGGIFAADPGEGGGVKDTSVAAARLCVFGL